MPFYFFALHISVLHFVENFCCDLSCRSQNVRDSIQGGGVCAVDAYGHGEIFALQPNGILVFRTSFFAQSDFMYLSYLCAVVVVLVVMCLQIQGIFCVSFSKLVVVWIFVKIR